MIVIWGRTAPSWATMTFSPLRALGAPQTICLMPIFDPQSTFNICKWLESGWFSHSIIWPITRFVPLARCCTSSTSIPAKVNLEANSSGEISEISTYLLNHFKLTFILSPPIS